MERLGVRDLLPGAQWWVECCYLWAIRMQSRSVGWLYGAIIVVMVWAERLWSRQ